MKTAIQIIQGVRKLLDKPESWTKRTFVRDAEGLPLTFVDDVRACSWCLLGAFHASGDTNILRKNFEMYINFSYEETNKAHIACNSILMEMGHGTLSVFNDEPATTHADVLNFLEKVEQRLAQS